MAAEDYERCDEGRVSARSDARAWLSGLGLDSVEGAFAHPGEARGRYKSLVRLQAPDGSAVFVKRYAFHRGEVALRGALKLNPAIYSGPREQENLLALAAAGVRVPVPLAAGEADRGAQRRSFVALAALRGRPLEEVAPPSEPAARRALLGQVAGLVRALHGAGFWHRDLYACNLFLAEGEPLGLLDCERVGQRAGLPRTRWRIKDLAALDYSLDWPTPRERLRALRDYLRGEARLSAWAPIVRKKAQRLERHGAKGP